MGLLSKGNKKASSRWLKVGLLRSRHAQPTMTSRVGVVAWFCE